MAHKKCADGDKKWLGTPVEELRRTPGCAQVLPPLRATDTHKVLIRVSSLHVLEVGVRIFSLLSMCFYSYQSCGRFPVLKLMVIFSFIYSFFTLV